MTPWKCRPTVWLSSGALVPTTAARGGEAKGAEGWKKMEGIWISKGEPMGIGSARDGREGRANAPSRGRHLASPAKAGAEPGGIRATRSGPPPPSRA
jgi:hypothetical protein